MKYIGGINVKKAIAIAIILTIIASAIPVGLAKSHGNENNNVKTCSNNQEVGKLRYFLDISVPAIKARASNEYSPYTVWEMGYHGEGINIAIMDSGVDDLIPQGHTCVDDMDDDETTYDPKFIAGGDGMSGVFVGGTAVNPEATDEGHGTHCAGIALGTGGGGESSTHRGVAPAARLIDMRVGAGTNLNMAGVMSALDWAIQHNETDWENDGPVNNGISVISMSFGGQSTNGQDQMAQKVNEVVEHGIVVVCAAGNGGQVRTPSTADRAICVANIDDHDTVDRSDDTINTGASSHGPRQDDGDNDPYDELKPDISAPGTNIVSAIAHTKVLLGAGTGSSMAAPHVAGVVALMLQANPDLRPSPPDYEYPIKRIMHDTAQKKGEASFPELSEKYNVNYGWGIIDAYGCVKRAVDLRTGIVSGPNECNSDQTVTFNARMNFTRTEYTIEDDVVKFKVFVPENFGKPKNIKLSSQGGVGYTSGYTEPKKNETSQKWEFEGWIRYTQDISDTRFCKPKITFDAKAPHETIDKNYDIIVHFFQNDIRGNKDKHTIKVKKATKPDLKVYKIEFTPNEPNQGEIIEIKATIEDEGGITSTTEVNFYDGNPDNDGKQIGVTQFIKVEAGGRSTASVNWDTKDNGGEHSIYVKIENTVPEESDTTNNIAHKNIYINQPPNIEVIIPNGGEVWSGEEDIHWNAIDPDKDDLSIDIFYSDNGGISWSEIAIGEENDGSYTWDTRTVSNGTNYLIKIKASDGYFTDEDTSNSTFEIRNEAPGNHAPEVKVTSPNGKEVWEGTNDIKWNAEDEDGDILKITIEYSINNGQDWTTIAKDIKNSGIYSWDTAKEGKEVPDTKNCLIRVKANDGKTTSYDISDDVFTVYNPVPPDVIEIYYPTEGEILKGMVNIDWNAKDKNWGWGESEQLNITIDYWNESSSKWENIIENYSNKQPSKYLWDTTTVPDGDNYKIRIIALDPTGLSDSLESTGFFTIWNEDILLEIKSPERGEEYSGHLPIKWKAIDRDDAELTIRIEYSKDGGNTWNLIKDNLIDKKLFYMDSSLEDDLNNEVITKNIRNAFSDGGYTLSTKAEVKKLGEGRWKITDRDKIYIIKKEEGDLNVYRPITEYLNWNTENVEDGDNYKIRITAYNESLSKSKTVEMDGVFKIDNPDTPKVEIISPSIEGEVWSGTKEIKWKATDADGDELSIEIWLYNQSTAYAQNLAFGIENTGSFIFDTTKYPDFDNYAIIIYATDPTERWGGAQSPRFVINNPDSPEVIVISPNGGENWSWENEIKWNASDKDGDELKIEIYIVNSTDTIKITTTSNTGSYIWNTTMVKDGKDYKIKVVAIEKTELALSSSDVSNGTFEIYNEGKYGIKLEVLGEKEKKGKAGDILEFEIMITNTGEMKDTFKIETSKLDNWIINLTSENLKENKITLINHLWEKIKVFVTIPEGERAGEKFEIQITATSEKSKKKSSVKLTIEIERVYGVKIETDNAEKDVVLGKSVIFNLTITNTGNDKDTITISYSSLNKDWSAEFDKNKIEISPGKSKVVILTITAPKKVDNLSVEGKLEIEITATSSNKTVKDTLKIIVHGKEVKSKSGGENNSAKLEIGIIVAVFTIPLIFVIVWRRRY